MPYGSMLHIPLTSLLLLAAKLEPYKKANLLTKNIEEFSGKSLEERACRKRKDRNITREEIAKWNQMTALRFQTGGRHQTSPASLRGHPARKFWVNNQSIKKQTEIIYYGCHRLTETHGI